jgi:Uma2 family endonuclease
MTISRTRGGGRKLLLYDVDWQTYSRLLRALAQRPSLRLTYDRGVLEIMAPLHAHESDSRFLGRLATTLSEELALPIKAGGSTTFRKRRKRRGLEPDDCFWIANEPPMRGKRTFDPRNDPPPDLAIEVDVSNSSLDRMAIYAALKVPEVWRLDNQALTFHVLGPDGNYGQVAQSQSFPGLLPTDLLRFLNMRSQLDENAVIRQFRAWIQQRVAAGWK